MVKGIDSFREWFSGYEGKYVVIGGTACDLLMSSEGLPFRATKDIDLVLITETLDADFARRFWEYVRFAGYRHCNKSTGKTQFYRFNEPKSGDYPFMIELFARKPEAMYLPEDAVISPLPVDDEISSLSAILLDKNYYEFLKDGRVSVGGITVLDAAHLIPFKAKAWIDLSDRKTAGENIDSKNIRKHKNDIFRLYQLLPNDGISFEHIPDAVRNDMQFFVERMSDEDIDLKQLGIIGRSKDSVLNDLRAIYI